MLFCVRLLVCVSVCVGVSVQVPVTEQTWHHLQGSVVSLTHLVPCDFFKKIFFKKPTYAVATLPENNFFLHLTEMSHLSHGKWIQL